MNEENKVTPEEEVEVVEEVTEEPKEEIDIQKGIVMYDSENGNTGYRVIGNKTVTLKDIVFYRRYLEKIEEIFWKRNEEENHAQSPE